jgi:hypothetical protein
VAVLWAYHHPYHNTPPTATLRARQRASSPVWWKMVGRGPISLERGAPHPPRPCILPRVVGSVNEGEQARLRARRSPHMVTTSGRSSRRRRRTWGSDDVVGVLPRQDRSLRRRRPEKKYGQLLRNGWPPPPLAYPPAGSPHTAHEGPPRGDRASTSSRSGPFSEANGNSTRHPSNTSINLPPEGEKVTHRRKA